MRLCSHPPAVTSAALVAAASPTLQSHAQHPVPNTQVTCPTLASRAQRPVTNAQNRVPSTLRKGRQATVRARASTWRREDCAHGDRSGGAHTERCWTRARTAHTHGRAGRAHTRHNTTPGRAQSEEPRAARNFLGVLGVSPSAVGLPSPACVGALGKVERRRRRSGRPVSNGAAAVRVRRFVLRQAVADSAKVASFAHTITSAKIHPVVASSSSSLRRPERDTGGGGITTGCVAAVARGASVQQRPQSEGSPSAGA